jgi:mRNA interferase MazF
MKDFDVWNEIKKKIDGRKQKRVHFPHEGEVWNATIGLNIGIEQNGDDESFSRPILVIKKFNNSMYWCVPLSTKQKEYDFYYNFIDTTGKEVSAILAQLRLVSIERFNRQLYPIDPLHLEKIKKSLAKFLV